MDAQHEAMAQRHFLSSHAGPYAIFDTAGRWVGVNPALCAALGRDESELIGEYFWDVLHPAHLQRTLDLLNRVSQFEGCRDFRNCYLNKAGEEVWLSWDCRPADERGLLHAHARLIPAQDTSPVPTAGEIFQACPAA